MQSIISEITLGIIGEILCELLDIFLYKKNIILMISTKERIRNEKF